MTKLSHFNLKRSPELILTAAGIIEIICPFRVVEKNSWQPNVDVIFAFTLRFNFNPETHKM